MLRRLLCPWISTVLMLCAGIAAADDAIPGDAGIPLAHPLNRSLQQTINRVNYNQQKMLVDQLTPPIALPEPSPAPGGTGISVPPGTSLNFIANSVAGAADAEPVKPAEAQADSIATKTPPVPDNRMIKLNFVNADLTVVVDYMASIYHLTPMMLGGNDLKITISTKEEITLREAFAIFTASVNNLNYAVVCNDKFMWVMPKSSSLQFPLKVFTGGDPSRLPESDEMVTAIIPCVNVSAATMKQYLLPITSFGMEANSVSVDQATNQLIVSDISSNLKRMMGLIKILDVPSPNRITNLETAVYYINYLNSKEMAACLIDAFKIQSSVTVKDQTVDDNQIIIQSYDDSNAILVTAMPSLQRAVAATIKELDQRKKQVLLEVKLIEATHSRNFDFATDFTFSKGDNSFRLGAFDAPTNANTMLSNQRTPQAAYTFSNENVSFAIQSLLVKAQGKVLSQPKLLTVDNQTASLSIGKQQPIVKSTTILNTSGTTPASNNTVSDYSYLNIGIKMDITPRINPNQDVTLAIDLTITDILSMTTVGGTNNVPIISERAVKTTGIVKHDHTLMIAGIISQEYQENHSSPPWLGDIPWIGWLFGQEAEEREQTELIILITPYVVEHDEAADYITTRERGKLNVNEENFQNFNRHFKELDKSKSNPRLP